MKMYCLRLPCSTGVAKHFMYNIKQDCYVAGMTPNDSAAAKVVITYNEVQQQQAGVNPAGTNAREIMLDLASVILCASTCARSDRFLAIKELCSGPQRFLQFLFLGPFNGAMD